MAWYTITLNNNGGSGTSPTTAYYNSSGNYWATAKNTGASYRLYSITTPTRANYVFNGFWTGSNNNGTQVIGSGGMTWGMATNPFSSTSQTVYAGWLPYATITLNKGEYGTGGTSSFYYKLDGGGFYSDTSLTTAITSITPPTGCGTFTGYTLNGVTYIDRNGNFTAALLNAAITRNYTLTASWFGGAVDYFGLASSALVPFESDDGITRPRVVTRHYGKGQGGDETGPVWMNPTTKYMVVANTTFATSLGKAFAAVYSGGTMTRTGYMITSVTIETSIGQFPVVTVSAVANEGADAINTFAISIPILGRARPQNLLNAFSGGGELQAYTLAAMCEPVVMQLALAPCASDAVNGRLEAHGETLAVYGESVPACTSAGGFTEVGTPSARSGVGWTRYSISGVKEVF